jgi:hypothetical protein
MTDTLVGKDVYRPSFHTAQVKAVLPEFFQDQYPKLIEFLEAYYAYEEENGRTFSEQIHELFHIRDITAADLSVLDQILDEISDNLEVSSFHPNRDPKLMARLLAKFYRAKGTQMSIEEFFTAFFDEPVEITYPKKQIFILNDRPSRLGPSSMKFLQDDRKFQIFSVLLKTGMSLFEYEPLYKKIVHPAGWYLAAELETQSEAHLNLKAGETVDPLEVPNYPVILESNVIDHLKPTYSLLVMEENDPVDARTQAEKDAGEGIIISSLETLDKYETITLQQIVDDFNDSIAEWVSVKSPTLDDGVLDMSQDYETLDGGDGTG